MRKNCGRQRLLVPAAALAVALLSGCGDGQDALDEPETSADSLLEDGAVSADEPAEVADAAGEDLAEGKTYEALQAGADGEELATLFQLLDVAGFDDVADAEQFTFFAPNDGALADIDTDLLAELLADPDALRDVLQDHFLEQVIFAADLPTGGTVTTAGGLELRFDLSGDQPTVNGIPIVRTDIAIEGRGVVHIIDGLLLED